MTSPSTAWKEVIPEGEEARFAGYAAKLAKLQAEKSAKYGTNRALHRKPRGAFAAKLEVHAGLPEHAAQGLFATPATHDCWIRLSNGAVDKQRDSTPDIRGLAIKVRGLAPAPGALGGTVTSQDFLLINHERFSAKSAEQFFGFIAALADGPFAVMKRLASTEGFFGTLQFLKGFKETMDLPFSGFATEPFFSAVPFCNGAWAVRMKLTRFQEDPKPGASADWSADFTERLARGPLTAKVQLQFFTEEAATPIEKPDQNWNEAEAPYLTVATLTIPQQDLTGAEGKALIEEVEKAAFDPWGGLMAHRPLGDVMRARKAAYFPSQKARGLHGG